MSSLCGNGQLTGYRALLEAGIMKRMFLPLRFGHKRLGNTRKKHDSYMQGDLWILDEQKAIKDMFSFGDVLDSAVSVFCFGGKYIVVMSERPCF